MHTHKGIVLKQFHNSHKMALLDEQLGRVDGICMKQLCVGSLVHYSVERQRNHQLYISHTSIILLPFLLAREDVLFLHHVLELCYYFIPIGNPLYQLFPILEFLYAADNAIEWTIHAKKLYLLKMLITIGGDVELTLEKQKNIQKLIGLDLADMLIRALHIEQEKIVDEWLNKCIAEHPAMEKFNTIQFLITNRLS